jgi:hypothetical protein
MRRAAERYTMQAERDVHEGSGWVGVSASATPSSPDAGGSVELF